MYDLTLELYIIKGLTKISPLIIFTKHTSKKYIINFKMD